MARLTRKLLNGRFPLFCKRYLIPKFDYYYEQLCYSLHIKYWLANVACRILPHFISGVIRARVYRMAGFKIGSGAYLVDNLELLSARPGFYSNLVIGANTLFGSHITINLDDLVIIEDNVTVGPYVRIYTGTHNVGPGSNRCQRNPLAEPVVIEKGSWIAIGVTILPGVRIGHGSVVAAGAVVTRDVPPNSFVTGVPGRVVKTLPDD